MEAPNPLRTIDEQSSQHLDLSTVPEEVSTISNDEGTTLDESTVPPLNSLHHTRTSPNDIPENDVADNKQEHSIIIEEISISDEEFQTRLDALLEVPIVTEKTLSEKRLYDLLRSWDLSILFKTLVDRKIDVDCLPALTEADYSNIARENQNLFGPMAKLRLRTKTILVEGSATQSSTGSNEIDLEKVLLNDVRGQRIRKFYNTNKQLEKAQQDLLIDVVLDHRLDSEMPSPIPTNEIERLVDKICEIFPNEQKAEYFIPKSKNSATSGRFFQRYNERLRKLRRQGIFPPSTKSENKKRKIEIEEELEFEDNDDLLQENIHWIKSYDHNQSIDVEDVITAWNETYEYRNRKLRREDKSDIIKDWPILRHPQSNQLIEIDFKKKFEDTLKNKPALPDAWNSLFSQSKIIFTDLRNATCSRILQIIEKEFNCDETKNEKNVILALALHGIFKPSLMGSGNKPSIVDSQDSFVQLTTENDFLGAVEERSRTRLSKNLTEHPYIVGISEIKEGITTANKLKRYNKYIYDVQQIRRIGMFRVIYGPIHFESDNFLVALDLCVKIFSTFKIPYPESRNVWSFLDQALYGLSNETNPQIVALLKKLK